MTDNEKIIDADVVDKTSTAKAKPKSTAKAKSKPESAAKTKSKPESVAKTKSEPESVAKAKSEPESVAKAKPEPESTANPKETRQKKTTNKALWIALLLVLAVSVGGIANLYKKVKVVEGKLGITTTGNIETKLNVATQPQANTASALSKADIDDLAKKLQILEKQTGEFAATQKILASIPQSVNQEIRKLSALEGKFSNLEKEVKTINDASKAKLDNPALLRAKPVIADGIRAAAISFDLKQAALLFQDAAIILHNMPDPQNTVTEEKLVQLSKDLNAAYTPDMVEIVSQIDTVINKVGKLAFVGDKNLESDIADAKQSTEKNTDKFAIKELASNVWTDFKSLVKISKDESQFVVVASNEARQAYRATILLKLEQAKLVALNSRQQEYDNLIQATSDTASKIFDKENPQVVSFIESLAVLSKIKVEPAKVDDKLAIAKEIIKK